MPQFELKLNNSIFDEEDKVHFFGMYASNPSNFAFLRGDVKLIMALVEHVKINVESNKASDHFQLKADGVVKSKQNWKGTVCTCVGVFFGEKSKYTISNNKITKSLNFTPEALRNSLLLKVRRFLETFSTASSEQVEKFTDDMVDVNIVDGKLIKATVQCVFCRMMQKTSRSHVFHQSTKNSNYWVLSNLKRHMDCHIKSENLPKTRPKSESTVDAENRDDEMQHDPHQLTSMPEKSYEENSECDVENSGKNSSSQDLSQYEDLLYTQISVQNLKMINSSVMQGEKKENLSFDIDEEVSGALYISRIKGDGNCLFAALAHQLFFVKLNSVDHEQLTAKLRENAVEYITQNYSSFEHELKNRIYENKSEIKNMQSECMFFLKQCLPRPGCWGGAESIKAISLIYRVNIIIFNEDGPFYLPCAFNTTFDRTVSVVFRIFNKSKMKKPKSNAERNHYDTVVEINQEIISECA